MNGLLCKVIYSEYKVISSEWFCCIKSFLVNGLLYKVISLVNGLLYKVISCECVCCIKSFLVNGLLSSEWFAVLKSSLVNGLLYKVISSEWFAV